MTPIQRLLTEAWQANQEAQFQILQAMSDEAEIEPQFAPETSLTSAINLQTNSSQKLFQAKTLIASKS